MATFVNNTNVTFINITSNASQGVNVSVSVPFLDKYEEYPDAYDIERVWYYLVGVVGSFVGSLGVVCNFLSLGVLGSKDMRSVTVNLYLIVLAVYDVVFLIANTLGVSADYFHFGLTGKNNYFNNFAAPAVPVIGPLMNICSTGSVYTSIVLSMDRVIGVTRPLQWPSICTRFRVKVVLFVTLLWSVILNIPFMLEYELKDVTNPYTNETLLWPVETDYSHTFFHTKVYLKYINPILDAAVPVVVITILNIIIALTMHRRHQQSQKMSADGVSRSKTSKDANRITAQVVFISVFTLLSRAMRVTTYVVMEHYDTMMVNFCPLFCGVIAAVSHFMMIVNATVNFFCYCIFGPKFRNRFLKRYGCDRCCKKKLQRQTTTASTMRFSRSTVTVPRLKRGGTSYSLGSSGTDSQSGSVTRGTVVFRLSSNEPSETKLGNGGQQTELTQNGN